MLNTVAILIVLISLSAACYTTKNFVVSVNNICTRRISVQIMRKRKYQVIMQTCTNLLNIRIMHPVHTHNTSVLVYNNTLCTYTRMLLLACMIAA